MIIDFRFLGQNGGSQGGGVTSGDVQSIVESYNYVNSGEVETQITEKGYLTSADTQIYLTSADTQGFVSTSDFEEATEVISTALNDLNTRVASAVTSTNITNILKITQSDYNTLVSAGTISNTTAYYIVPDPVVGE